jgi:hypothetical protein
MATMTDSSGAAEQQQVLWSLPRSVLSAIEGLAAAEGTAVETMAEQILRRGIAEAGVTPNGRCSVRTGLCSEGPTLLPIQQS